MTTPTRVARKQYTCEICAYPIFPGIRHVFRRLAPWEYEDGEHFWSFRSHEACYEVVAEEDGEIVGSPYDWRQYLDECQPEWRQENKLPFAGAERLFDDMLVIPMPGFGRAWKLMLGWCHAPKKAWHAAVCQQPRLGATA